MIQIERAQVRRFFYLGSILAIALLSGSLSAFQLARLRTEREDELLRLREVIMEGKRAYLRDAVLRTIQEIDTERRLAREELGFPAGLAGGTGLAGVAGQAGHAATPGAARADELARKRMRARIRDIRLADGGYIWVNRVLDYGGGEGYAVREIHPNLPETEGMLLSTSMQDVAGGRPYLVELEGVKSRGELFFEYFFKKLDTEEIAKKISFAKLYPDFDWIVATGAYLDDVELFVAEARSRAEAAYRSQLWAIALATALGLLGAGLVLVIFERRAALLVVSYNKAIAEGESSLLEERRKVEEAYAQMKDAAERDQLTGLRNRRSALERLELEAARARWGGGGFCVAMLDLNRFKDVNDEFGHECGDAVLGNVAEILVSNLRAVDQVARWGGEEFLLILTDIGLEEARVRVEALRAALDAASLECLDPPRATTATFGLARFEAGEEPSDTVRRADQALYEGKRLGRNRVVLARPSRIEFP